MNKIITLITAIIAFSCTQKEKEENSKSTIPAIDENIEVEVTAVENDSISIGEQGKKLTSELFSTLYEFHRDPNNTLLDVFYGKLNDDEYEDAVVIIQNETNEIRKEIMLVYLRNADNYYSFFAKNETIISEEYFTVDRYSQSTKDISIKNHELEILLNCYGPCGNTIMNFTFHDNKLMLTNFGTFQAGAGSQYQTDYNANSKIATITLTNTMTDEMPSETTEVALNYEKQLDFAHFKPEDLFKEISSKSDLSL